MVRHSLVMILTILGTIFFSAGLSLAQTRDDRIIDVHAHLTPGPGMSFERALASAISEMDKHGIAVSILMSPPRTTDVPGNYDAQDVRSGLNQYAGRLHLLAGGGSLNHLIHRYEDPSVIDEQILNDFAEQANSAIDQGALGFGEISSLHISLFERHGYGFVPADHPMLLRLADVAASRDVPVDLHMDAVANSKAPPPELAKFPNNPKEFPATIGRLERLLEHNRNAKIVWAHGGTDHIGDYSSSTVGGLMDRHENLYMSLKIAGPRSPSANKLFRGKNIDPGWLSVLKRHSDRFVIGTDSFYVDPDGSGPLVSLSKKAGQHMKVTKLFLEMLPDDLSIKIARENAEKIYNVAVPDSLPAKKGPTANRPSSSKRGLCRDGNMDHCKIACGKGNKNACARLKRGG